MQRVISFTLAAILMIGCSVTPVHAEEYIEEFNPNGSGIVWSEDVVEGWQLTWTSNSFYDTLLTADKDGVSIQYEYDEAGNRVTKLVNEVVNSYTYEFDELYGDRLIAEDRNGSLIQYKYEFSYEKYDYILVGFVYDGVEYDYIYNEYDIIAAIVCNGVVLAEYSYFNDICEAVYAIDENGNKIDKTDDDSFIGNINPFRYRQYYYDCETGWYYIGRYYSACCGRFVDGVSPIRAEALKQEYPEYEVVTKTYTCGVNQFSIMKRDMTAYSDVVARVLYFESNVYTEDLLCVAWVVKNRILSSSFPNTSYDVVTQREGDDYQFEAYKEKVLVGEEVNTKDPCWAYAMYLALILEKGNPMPTKPSGFDAQLYFSSFGSISEAENLGEVFKKQYINNMGETKITYIYDCWSIPTGNISGYSYNASDYTQYEGKYNVFCSKTFTD